MMISKKQRWLLLGGVGVVIVLVLFGMWSRVSRTLPVQSLAAASRASTFHAKAELTLHLPERLKGKPRPFTQVISRVEGDVARGEGGVPELTGRLRVEATGKGALLFAEGEARILREAVAFKLHDLPVLLNPSGSLIDKWTYVDSSLLAVKEPQAVQTALQQVFSKLSYHGRERVDGESLRRFDGTLTEKEEQQLATLLSREQSGNLGLDVVARLLKAHKLKRMSVWVGSQKELRRVELTFVHPLQRGGEFDFATLTLTFTEYGKSVTIDRPEKQLTVEPKVFARLFGNGDVEAVQR
jgi:hypothetical protein